MRKIILILAACSISACAPLAAISALSTLPSSPSAIAQTTKADEQAAIGAELGYKAFRLSVEVSVSSGMIKGALAGKLLALDSQLYSALQVVEHAYAAGNAASFVAALASFNTALAEGNALVKPQHGGM